MIGSKTREFQKRSIAWLKDVKIMARGLCFPRIRYPALYDRNGTYWSRILTVSPFGVITQASARSW